MRESIYLRLVNAEKIPYTAAGFSIIGSAIRTVLQTGVAVGGYSDFEVIVPNPMGIDENSRANRVAKGFEFTAKLASAVHFVEVKGHVHI